MSDALSLLVDLQPEDTERLLSAGRELDVRRALAQQHGGTLPDEAVAAAHADMNGFCKLLEAQLGESSGPSESVKAEVAALIQRDLYAYMKLSHIVERVYTKPRGYAGDFLTIEWMYEHAVGGHSPAGALFDMIYVNRPAAKAVVNRRKLLAEEIAKAVEQGGKVTSMACGPARELFDIFEGLQDKTALQATCLDIDLHTLALVGDRSEAAGLKRQIRLEQANLVYLATGRTQLDIEPQNLVYSIGLIDDFKDRFVIALLDWVHGILAPGGKVILGNFHPQNPDRALMDNLLDWKLIHRDEDDMHRLFQASKFGARCSEIRYEPEGVNLFAMGVKV